MVIDKWTRTSNNNNLATPLLGHKSKETFSELQKQYKRLQNLNHKYKKNSKSSLSKPPYNRDNSPLTIDYADIRNYIDKISSIFITINQLITENDNFEIDKADSLDKKDINCILNLILLEYNLFLNNIKEIENNIDINNNLDIDSLCNECKLIGNVINKKLNKEKDETNNIVIQEQRRNINDDLNRNIDRGQINILTHRREFNNSLTIVKNNFHYTVEEERLGNGIKLSLFFIVVFFVLFIFYIFLCS